MQIVLHVDSNNISEIVHAERVLRALLSDEVQDGGLQSTAVLSPYPSQDAPPTLAGGQFVTGLSVVAPVVFSEEDAANATRELAVTLGIPAATDLLRKFTVERTRDLAPDRREAYVTEAKHLATEWKKAQEAKSA
jgi:hypothetical protein